MKLQEIHVNHKLLYLYYGYEKMYDFKSILTHSLKL